MCWKGRRPIETVWGPATIEAGELQHMTAGSGILHSEFDPSSTERVHLYQIWLRPEQTGLEPAYEQKTFSRSERVNRFQLWPRETGRMALW